MNSAPAGGRSPSAGKRVWTDVHLIVMLLSIAAFLTVFIGFLLYLYVLLDVPNIRSVAAYRPPMTSRVLDRNGAVVARFYEENRIVVPLKEMPVLLGQAFVAAEDDRFYDHPGVDLWSIFRAMVHNISAGSRAHGGSTITQQVTRSLLLSRKKLFSRKIKEAILAYRIDSRLSKDEILYIYLNQIYLGSQAYGVGAAAETYFNKSVGQLDLAEMALLAGLPQSPSRYSPYRNMELARQRQMYVLNRMAEEGYISADQARAAYGKKIRLAPASSGSGNEYFIQQVYSLLDEMYGDKRVRTEGFTIRTTLDQDLQLAAEQTLAQGIPRLGIIDDRGESPQAGLIALEIGSGKVRAVAGGTGFASSQFNRATQARRQPGSAMKPLVYAAAFENKFTPETVFEDAPLKLPGSGRGKFWIPKNFDNTFHGPMSLGEALVTSNNIVTIKLLKAVGVKRVVALARKMGITSPMANNLSLALGSADLSLIELTAAYTAFADHGRYNDPVFIDSIHSRDNDVVYAHTPAPAQVISRATADLISSLLARVVASGTGQLAGKDLPLSVAGKTGTTDSNVDAWFIGYTPRLAAGVWIGFDRQRSMGAGATGGRIAAPVWNDFIRRAGKKAIAR